MEPISRADAVQIQKLALTAIEALTAALNVALPADPSEFYEQVKHGVGISIGTIDTQLLSVIYKVYPDLDDLK